MRGQRFIRSEKRPERIAISETLPYTPYLLIAAAYLLGSIPFGLLIGKAHGVDIREQGSGNIGATNLGRALGKRWAFAAFLLDFAKGIFPVLTAGLMIDAEHGREAIRILAGTASILGHTFPVFLKFKGGKGVATTFGVIAAVALPAGIAAGLIWVILYLTTRTVSIASLAAGITLPIATCFLDPPPPFSGRLVFAIAVAALILIRHRKNIARILRGEELTFKKKTKDEQSMENTTLEKTETAGTKETDSPILVLGNGGWGTAIAMVLRSNGHEVRVWGHDADYTREIESSRENRKYLTGLTIPDGIEFGSDVARLSSGVETVFSVVPTQFLRSTLVELREELPATALYVSCSKGFERGTLELPSAIISSLFTESKTAVLGGPSHAEEVSLGLPATVVVGCEDEILCSRIQQVISSGSFRVYTSKDPRGVEVAGASKNVIALAAGISDGLGYGDNARAALVCRGATELTRLGAALECSKETFAGLSGIGDLVATCTSQHSRNHAVGQRIGEGETLEEILASSDKVAEGVETTRSMYQLSQKIGVELPITAEVYRVLFEEKAPDAAVADLMGRELKRE